jgi:hypothetical protein
MRKLGICLVLLFFVLGVSCFAQTSNDAQRIVGTWNGPAGSGGMNIIFIFNSNGTYSVSGSDRGSGNYIFSGSKLLLENYNGTTVGIFDYYFSTDGKQLVIGGRGNYWLRKQ